MTTKELINPSNKLLLQRCLLEYELILASLFPQYIKEGVVITDVPANIVDI